VEITRNPFLPSTAGCWTGVLVSSSSESWSEGEKSIQLCIDQIVHDYVAHAVTLQPMVHIKNFVAVLFVCFCLFCFFKQLH